MHCEVAAILNDALRAVSEQLVKDDERFQRLAAAVRALPDVPVILCPEKFDAEMTSEVLFPLADQCLPESQFSPPIFAAQMATWCENNVAQYLTLNPSSFGHLNVVTSSWFKQELLQRFVTQGAEALFSPTLLLYPPRFAPGEVSANEKAAFQLLEPNWGELAERARTSHNPDLRKLSKAFPEFVSPPERMMCLALLADAELSVDAFLAKYQGRENVAWYVRRFLVDSENFIEQAAKVQRTADSRFAELASTASGEFERRLLCFRYAVSRAAGGDHAELFGHCLLVMRAFYRFYNHPSLRSQLSAQVTTKSLVEVARNAVRLVLRRQGLVGAAAAAESPPAVA